MAEKIALAALVLVQHLIMRALIALAPAASQPQRSRGPRRPTSAAPRRTGTELQTRGTRHLCLPS
jgi:hypothetical protein